MAAESLRDELLALPGVADAEVDENSDAPSGVRVKLSPDADARRVGVEVQRILASHGLRSRVAGDEADPVPPEEPPPTPIIGLPSFDDDSPPAFFGDEPATPPPPSSPPPMPDEDVPTVRPAPAPAAPAGTRLEGVRLEERRDGVEATAVGSDGRTVTLGGLATPESMMEAVAAATGTLAEGEQPTLLGIERTLAAGSEVITVIVERADGTRRAGAAVVQASRAFAVGRATWTALRAD